MVYISRDVLFESHLGIPPVLVFQLEVYYKVDRLLTGLTAQRKGTTARWYSNKTSLGTYTPTLRLKMNSDQEQYQVFVFTCYIHKETWEYVFDINIDVRSAQRVSNILILLWLTLFRCHTSSVTITWSIIFEKYRLMELRRCSRIQLQSSNRLYIF